MLKLHDEWVWIVNHAWSARFMLLAFILSCAETFLPHYLGANVPHGVYAGTMALLSAAAYLSRVVAQDHTQDDPVVDPVLQKLTDKVESEKPQ